MVTKEEVKKLREAWEKAHAETEAASERESEVYREWMSALRQLDDQNPSLKTNSPT